MIAVSLQKKIESHGCSLEGIAKKINCSRPVLSKFFTKRETIDFDIVINMVKLLTPEQEKDLMFDYCREISRPNQLKCAFEYASIHSNVDLLFELLQKFKNHKNKEVKELNYLYQLIFDRQVGSKDYIDVYKEILDFQPSTVELQCLKLIMEMHYYYQSKMFKQIDKLTSEFIQKIEHVKSDFVKRSLTVRHNQMLSYVLLHVHNKPEESRKLALESVECDLGSNTNGFFYNIVGTSYFNQSIEKMNHYATKSVNEYRKTYPQDSTIINDLINRFHKLNAIMSDNLSLELPKDKDDPIDLYIEGKYSNDIFKMIECLVELTKRNNNFFAEITLKQLRIMGCSESLVNSITSINSRI